MRNLLLRGLVWALAANILARVFVVDLTLRVILLIALMCVIDRLLDEGMRHDRRKR